MRHDKKLIIFLRINWVTVNRPEPPLIETNETFVTEAHGPELHLNVNTVAETPVLLKSAPAPHCISWTLLASGNHVFTARAVKRDVGHVVHSFVAHVRVSAHTCPAAHNPSLAKSCHNVWAPLAAWKMAWFRVKLCLWKRPQQVCNRAISCANFLLSVASLWSLKWMKMV